MQRNGDRRLRTRCDLFAQTQCRPTEAMPCRHYVLLSMRQCGVTIVFIIDNYFLRLAVNKNMKMPVHAKEKDGGGMCGEKKGLMYR